MTGYYPLPAYYPLVEILILSFNAILFVLLSVLLFRELHTRRERWGGYLYPASVCTLTVLFAANLANKFAVDVRYGGLGILYAIELACKCLVPPLLFHLFYWSEREYLPARRLWQACLAALYVFGVISAICSINVSAIGWSAGYPGWPAITLLARIGMICGGVGCALTLFVSRRRAVTVLDRNRRRWLIGASVLWVGAFLAGTLLPKDLAGALEKAPALVFIFVITYYVERFRFFDVLIKKGAFIFASLCLLTLMFVFLGPLLKYLRFTTWIGSLAWALLVWPIVLLAPWGHRKLSAWLDRRWLGRLFSPAEATKYFFDGLEGAISEPELAQRAAAHLGTIFRSTAEVSFDDARAATGTAVMTAPIRLSGCITGQVRILSREQNVRFLSEDLTLLESLTDGLAFLLENLRLREKRLEQEKRETALILDAHRSELKALRAQVNPHFLFNALNTIAGLIPRHPARAEETIEELAEVFRYTLHRSEREWVRLGEELEVVDAYLRVEQARFGERLQYEIAAGAAARDVRIPAMIVQTLVENAVKHGISKLTAGGAIQIRAAISESHLRIEVRDSGPGFPPSELQTASHGLSGYGLRNVRDRLRGYFGDAARLSIARDAAMTVVGIDMPLTEAAVAGGVG
jgi:signal transduction histidine kinase